MTYDSTTRSFDIDTRNARGLDKYVGDGQLIPEIYWASIKYHWEKTKDKGIGLALKQFQECLANCGIPVPGPPIEWELKSIPRDTPTSTVLRPYQAKAVKHLVRGSMILGDQCGLGKSLSALWAWWLLGRRWGGGPLLTIITPSDDVADEWCIAARTHLGDDCVTHLKTGGVGRVWEEPAVAVPYFRCWRDGYSELIKHRLSLYQAQNQGSILVLDEAHRVSRCDSVQHKFLWSLVRDNPHIRVWALSGTEVSNTPDGYYGLYRMVTRSKLPQVAWKAFVQDLWTGAWNETRLKQIHTLRRGFALRRTSENVGQELPPLIEIDCKVEMHPVQAQLYAEIKNEQQMSVVTDPNAPAQTTNITHFWTSNIRLTQVASHPLLVGDKTVGKTPKYERLMELVEGAGDEKIIIWCNFPKANNWLAEQLEKDFPGKTIARAHGGISKDDRQIAKTEFQAGRVDILIANPAVWSEGVNLIPGRIMIYWDYTASRVQWEQSRKRSHRTGQTKTVTIYKLITIGSIEVKWLHWLTRKASLADLISGG